MRAYLFAGTLLIFLAFYKGDGGYHDLVNYLDDAEGLWLHGDMSRGMEEEELPDGKIVEHPTYSQYSLGLAFVSGPFVLLAKAVDLITGEKTIDDNGRIGLSPHARKIAVLIIPLFAALTCLLIFEIGQLQGVSARASLWAAMMLAVASPLPSFARLYYTEVAVIFFTVLSVWAFLKCMHSSGRAASLWALLAGAGAAGAAGSHYAEAVLIAPVGIAMAVSVLVRRDTAPSSRAIQLGALAVFPILGGAAILAVNYARRGSAFATGYDTDVDALAFQNILHNARYILGEHLNDLFEKSSSGAHWLLEKPGLLVRNLWVLPAMIALLAAGKRDDSRVWKFALLTGVVLQILFWMSYSMLAFSPVRYFQPATGALAIGLVYFGAHLERWSPRWGLLSVGLVLIAWNAMFFFMNDDHNAPFAFGDPPERPLLIYTWYMEPFKNGLTDGYGTPVGTFQWAVLMLLLAGGITCWAKAWRTPSPPVIS